MTQLKVFNYFGHVLELDPAFDHAKGSDMPAAKGNGVAAPATGSEVDGGARDGHEQGAYLLPYDEAEQDRLNRQHELCRLVLDGRLGLAPVRSPKRVLDIATGTGIWAIQYAEQNPGCEVVGTDMEDFQRESPVPNCSFVRHDAEKDAWDFGDKFDYIHMRFVLTCFDDTKAVIQRAYDSLNPGGYMELYDVVFGLVDLDGTVEGTALARWNRLVAQGGRAIGRDLDKAARYPQWCREAGFVDVEEQRLPQPVGPWARDARMKTIGRLALQVQLGLISGALVRFLELAGLAREQVEELVGEATAAALDPGVHAGVAVRVTYGRKPESRGGGGRGGNGAEAVGL